MTSGGHSYLSTDLAIVLGLSVAGSYMRDNNLTVDRVSINAQTEPICEIT